MIPDRIIGLDIKECCNVHDFMYRTDTKAKADKYFKKNMALRISQGSKWRWLVAWRKTRAAIYYKVVTSKASELYYNKLRRK